MSFLTKSDFKVARTCPTKLHYKKNNYPTTHADNEYLELLEQGGYMVDAIAKLLFPAAVPIMARNSQEALHATQTLMRQEQVTLLEAAFVSQNKFARPDILVKSGNALTLIEVKAKSFDGAEAQARLAQHKPNLFRNIRQGEIAPKWQPYLEDITFQALILRELFPQAQLTCELMMPDTSLTTTIDKLYSLFELTELALDETGYPRVRVTFKGDPEQLRHDHFLTRINVDEEVHELLPSVASAANTFVASLLGHTPMPTPLSLNCRECEYHVAPSEKQNGYRECWGALAEVQPHIFEMYHVSQIAGEHEPLANELIAQGKTSLLDIPEATLVKKDGTVGERNRRQVVQRRHTQANTEWVDPALRGVLASFAYPLHFMDFETSALAVPYHAGMHPYENVAFQWSCHTLPAPEAAPIHTEWINVEDAFPNFAFAESLMNHLGRTGTMFMWATHENSILKDVRRQMLGRYAKAELLAWLEWLTDNGEGRSRLVDMNNLTVKHYFHPLMKGRTSIKKVLDAIWKTNAVLHERFPNYLKYEGTQVLSPYQSLPPLLVDDETVLVAEGTGAIRAYQEMLYGKRQKAAEHKVQWRQLLLQYCELDTAAMVMVYWHWQQRLRELG